MAMVTVEFLEIMCIDSDVRWCEWTEKIEVGRVKAMIKEYRTLDELFAKKHNATFTFHARIYKEG